MLRTTGPSLVVFTQGCPALAAFAARHFLPSHPLSSSNLWLDENDFEATQHRAKRLGVASPLRINPHSHHPELSPYAKPGRGRKRSSSSNNNSGNTTTAADLFSESGNTSDKKARKRAQKAALRLLALSEKQKQYATPICAALLHRHNYLFNLEQVRGTDMLGGHMTYEKSDALLRSDKGGGGSSRAASLSGGDACNVDDRVTTHDDPDQLWAAHFFPQPSVPKMHSIRTRKAFSEVMNAQLHQIARAHGYSSRWWGTGTQWRREGACPRPHEQEHLVYLPIMSKLVHISLIDNAEEVLRNSYISAKSGTLSYMFPQFIKEGYVGGHSDVLDVKFPQTIQEDMAMNKYRVPLYFSSKTLQRWEYKLKPNTRGLDFAPQAKNNNNGNSSQQGALDPFLIPPAIKQIVGENTNDSGSSLEAPSSTPQQPVIRYYYHMSHIQFPSSYRVPLPVLSAELSHGSGVPLHGATGRRLPHAELSVEGIAQVDPQLAASIQHVAVAEDEPLATMTDAVVQQSESATEDGSNADSTNSSNSALLMALMGDKVSRCTTTDTIIPPTDEGLKHYEHTHGSPLVHLGRSLWYLSEDILQIGGIVNVNAAPVEVRSPDEGGGAFCRLVTDDGEVPPSCLFNVSCLVNEDDGFRVVCQRVLREPQSIW